MPAILAYALFFTLKLKMTKILMVYFGVVLSNAIMVSLAISDAGWMAIGIIMPSFFSLAGLVILALINKKVAVVAKSINGLLEEKVIADKKIGAEEEKVRATRDTAIGDKRELKIIKDQQLRDQIPNQQYQQNPENKSDVKEAKDEIIEAVEDEIQRVVKAKGDEIQETVETKGDEIHEGVNEIPEKVVEIIKTPPPTQ